MAQSKVSGRSVEPCLPLQLDVFSNPSQQESVSLLGGMVRLQYWESIMQDTVRATVVFADTGTTIRDKTAVDGLPIVGQERVILRLKDLNDNELTFKDSSALYVN